MANGQTIYSDNTGASGGVAGGSPGLGGDVLTGLQALADFLIGRGTSSAATDEQTSALKSALAQIQQSSDRAQGYLTPYQQGGQQDYNQLRTNINSGYYQTPYDKSYTSQTMPQASFSFNPSQGTASFGSFQPTGGPATFTPSALPQRPQATPMTPPAAQGGGQPFSGQRMDPQQLLQAVFKAFQSRQGNQVQNNQGVNPMPPGQQNNPAQNPMGQPGLMTGGRLPFNFNPMDPRQFPSPMSLMPGGRLGGSGPYG
jgi:hypothetical protein